jgi:hypothetical protein
MELMFVFVLFFSVICFICEVAIFEWNPKKEMYLSFLEICDCT